MKLKKLLSGVTAAIIALSSVAIASFTSVSAAGEYVKIFSGEAGSKVFAQGVVDASMAGATKMVITANAGPTPQGFNEYCTLDVTSTVGGKEVYQKLKPANPGWPGPATTTYTMEFANPLVENDSYVYTGATFSWEDCITEENWVIGITKVEFYNGDTLVKTLTEVGTEPPKQDPKPGDDNNNGGNTSKSLTANLYFASPDFEVQPNGTDENGGTVGVPLEITGDGEYTFNVTSLETDKWRGNVSQAAVFVIDFLDARKTHPQMKAELLSIKVPDYENSGTKEVTFDKSKTIFGDIEYPKNENLRLEIHNIYGETVNNPAIDPLDIYFEFGDTMTVTIKVTDFSKGIATPNNNNTTAKKPAVNTTKKTRSADQVKKDKAAAKNAMKKAKIKTVNAKSKAKKINVSWKKVKKAKGYEVQVSTNKKFKKSKIVFKKLTTKKKLTIKNKKIKSKKTYYVRVRAYATYKDKNFQTQKMFSAWSKKVAKVKVK